MILVVAVVAGLIAGLLRVAVRNRYKDTGESESRGQTIAVREHFVLPRLQQEWLVVIAFVPQLPAFYLPFTDHLIADSVAALMLTLSQGLLLLFGWRNRHHRAFYLLTLGLLANFLVIISNGGLMPMSPETLGRLVSPERAAAWQIGERIAQTKDRLIREEETYFALLSDRFVLPQWTGYAIAYSIGDCIVALGAFWLLWDGGKSQSPCRASHLVQTKYTGGRD